MSQLFQPRNSAITKDDRYRAAVLMYENYICQYKAILLQCEKDFDLMINVRLYLEIVVPYFTVKHGQFAAVALTRSGANKMLTKTWEAFILQRDRILLREHQKILVDQRKFDTQLKNAQLSAGEQIDDRIDKHLDAKVKSIIKETVKSQSIKKENLTMDPSLFECELTNTEFGAHSFSQPSSSVKRTRQSETIDLRSPVEQRTFKKQSYYQESGKHNQPKPQRKGYEIQFLFT